MFYPIVLHKEPASDYGVTVPDLPGCFTAGTTVDEALAFAQEAIELHLEGLIEEGGVVPHASSLEHLQSQAEFSGGSWALVPIDPGNLRLKVKRVQITIPERTLNALDRYAKEHGGTRSGVLTEAVIGLIGKHDLPKSKRGRPHRRPEEGTRPTKTGKNEKRASAASDRNKRTTRTTSSKR